MVARTVRRWRRAFAVLLRTIAVIVCFQLSGVGHALDDLAHLALDAGIECENPDCDDRSDCPPGAADCHHPHSNVIPPSALAELIAALAWRAPGERLALLYDDTFPVSIEPSGLERPPRPLGA